MNNNMLHIFYKQYFDKKKDKINYKKFVETSKILYSIYDRGYQPPMFIFEISEKDIIRYMKSTIIYYEKEKDKILCFTREPVNIEMNRYYDSVKMLKYFGYKTSLYNEKSSNIAIFTKTPVQYREKNIILDINVLNVIGVALDNQKQYDYIKLSKINHISDRINEYENMVRKYFIKIKKCFIDNNYEILFLSAIGLGNFATLCPLLEINPYKIFNKILNEVFDDIINKICNKKVILWCFSNNLLRNIIIKNKYICNLYLEDLLYEIYSNNNEYLNSSISCKVNVNKILFTNAYDPYSLVGNGNNNDNSLDGYFGRISAMSILCWPFTNPFIKFIKIKI
jgi:hypothetical protein